MLLSAARQLVVCTADRAAPYRRLNPCPNHRLNTHPPPALPLTYLRLNTHACSPAPQVTQAEGFSKRVLFEMLDGLDRQTRPLMESARKALAEAKGQEALKVGGVCVWEGPWRM